MNPPPVTSAPNPQRPSGTAVAVSDLRTTALAVSRDGRITNEEGAQLATAFSAARSALAGKGFDHGFETMLGQLTAERDGLPAGSAVHAQRDLALKALYNVWNHRHVSQP